MTNQFNLVVNPVNDPPTLNPLASLNINEDAGLQTIVLNGISSGAANENQTLTVSQDAAPCTNALAFTSANGTRSRPSGLSIQLSNIFIKRRG